MFQEMPGRSSSFLDLVGLISHKAVCLLVLEVDGVGVRRVGKVGGAWTLASSESAARPVCGPTQNDTERTRSCVQRARIICVHARRATRATQ